MNVHDYETADELLKNRDREKVAHETWLKRISDDEIAVVYHSTSVVRYFNDGSIKIHNGGRTTKTTKKRINDFQKVGRVFQEKFEWFFSFYALGKIPFEDGMYVLKV